eukprot:scaffold51057_cov36-Phaeocystis_antarctica.AAC.2
MLSCASKIISSASSACAKQRWGGLICILRSTCNETLTARAHAGGDRQLESARSSRRSPPAACQ